MVAYVGKEGSLVGTNCRVGCLVYFDLRQDVGHVQRSDTGCVCGCGCVCVCVWVWVCGYLMMCLCWKISMLLVPGQQS